MPHLHDRLAFFAAADALKETRRACWIYSDRRHETVAEHVWHAALLALVMRDLLPREIDGHHLRNLLIVHDLVEVYAGDTSVWDDAGADGVEDREMAAGERLMAHLPRGSAAFTRIDALWREFQAQESLAAQAARAIDSMHPMINSWAPGAPGHPMPLTPRNYESPRKRVPLDRFTVTAQVSRWLVANAMREGLMPPEPGVDPVDLGEEASTLVSRLRFLTEADALKRELRSNHILSAERRESVAEHCWHLMLLALLCEDIAPHDVDLDRVLDLLLIHDLVEVYAGDTPVHLIEDALGLEVAEQESAARLLGFLPDDPVRDSIAALIGEFQASETPDARFARALDALHPALMTWGPGSHPHPDLVADPPVDAVVLGWKRPSMAAYPALWDWLLEVVEEQRRSGGILRG